MSKKVEVMLVTCLLGFTSLPVFAESKPMIKLETPLTKIEETLEFVGVQTILPAEKEVDTKVYASWFNKTLDKANNYGITINTGSEVSVGEMQCNLMRLVGLVDTLKEKESFDSETIETTISMAKEVNLKTDYSRIEVVIADLNYMLMLQVFSGPEYTEDCTRIELGEAVYELLKEFNIPTTRMAIQYRDTVGNEDIYNFLGNTGLMTGDSGLFRPNDDVTTEEFISVLVRVYEILEKVY